MAWCHQATSHYLNQCWPRSPLPSLGNNELNMTAHFTYHISPLFSLIDFWNGIGTITVLTCLTSGRFLSVKYHIVCFSIKTVITNYHVLHRVYPKSYARCLYTVAFNLLRAKFLRGNINIYLHFVSIIHIDMTQVLKILPQVREGPTYST